MNRDEKNLQTRQKIIDSSFAEFSEKSYGEASLNTICSVGGISKGIIYHYFSDKDELYLACVKECFDSLTSYLDNIQITSNSPIEQSMASYFDSRIAFFRVNPLYLGVFCSAIINPPSHLLPAIEDISAKFDAQAVSILTALLKTVKLRSDVTILEVVEMFRQYQDFVHTRFQMKASHESTLKEHEDKCRRALQILIYGVLEREVSL